MDLEELFSSPQKKPMKRTSASQGRGRAGSILADHGMPTPLTLASDADPDGRKAIPAVDHHNHHSMTQPPFMNFPIPGMDGSNLPFPPTLAMMPSTSSYPPPPYMYPYSSQSMPSLWPNAEFNMAQLAAFGLQCLMGQGMYYPPAAHFGMMGMPLLPPPPPPFAAAPPPLEKHYRRQSSHEESSRSPRSPHEDDDT